MADLDRRLDELIAAATRGIVTPPADAIRRRARQTRRARAATGAVGCLALAGVVAVAVVALPTRGAAPSPATRPTAPATVEPTPSPVPTPAPSAPNPSSSPSATRLPSQFPPTASNVVHGGRYWAVYLAIARTYDDPKLEAAKREARGVGYQQFSGGDIDCDRGAREGLARAGIRLDPNRSYTTVSLLFDTQRNVQAFVDAYAPPVVGTVLVTVYCYD